MIITDEEILHYIRRNYSGYSQYTFSGAPIGEEADFIIVKDIHEINEDVLNTSKDIFVRGLQPGRQTNCINISNLCDSLNAESCDLGEEVYKELERYNRIYSKAYLRNGTRWVDLKAFNLACDKAKELVGNNNPRVLFNISKYSQLLNTALLNTTNLRLSLVNLRSLLELMHTEIRKMNYDMILRPVTTIEKKDELETLVQSKYINNFFLHDDIKFDHEHQVFGTIAGLAARKNKGEFGKIKPYYYQFRLCDLLKKEYGYLNLEVEALDGRDNPVKVNGKQIAHKVLLRRKKISGNFSSFSKFTARALLNYRLPAETWIYDYENPIELSALLEEEVTSLVKSGEGMVVYKIDETLYDSYSVYDTVNPQSNIVVGKGEFFDAQCNLFGIIYNEKIRPGRILDYPNHFLVFSKTLKSDHVQRVKLFDSMISQQQNAILRAEQAEKALEDLKKSNEYIAELNAGLQDRVAERTRELEIANEQRTNAFINLAHETKTPLTLVNNYLQEYIRKHGETEELRVIQRSIGRLTNDIVNFFDLERIKRGWAIYDNDQIAEFSKILRDSLVLFKQYGRTKNIVIVEFIEENVMIRAAPEALHRILNNLIENAVRYTDENGTIEVTLVLADNKILFSVKDNGIGISAEAQEKIFEPYYQLKAEKKSLQGMGMGLAIVKKITESLNGEVILRSNPEKEHGTEIIVQLPVYEGNNVRMASGLNPGEVDFFDASPAQVKDEIRNEDDPFVMLVEDNCSLLNFMSTRLKEKYNIYVASSGAEALEKLKTINRLDLIVSDVMMDNVNGYELYCNIAGQKRLSHIPFIFLSAKTGMQDKIQGLSMGAVDYISKPFLMEELSEKIESILKNLEQQRIAIINNTYKTLLQQSGPGKPSHANSDPFEEACVKHHLTSREKEIVRFIAQGKIYKEIADALTISDKTVAKHIQNMFEKTSATNKVELLNRLGISALAE